MSATTRHLINRQRRLAATATATTTAPRTATAARTAAAPRTAAPSRTREPAVPKDRDRTPERTRDRTRSRRLRTRLRIPLPQGIPLIAALTLLTVLLGCFAAWAAGKASALHDSAATGNTALTDTARTSEVKGTVAQAVNAVFSYDYADPARTDDAAKLVLTGQAVQQYASMIAEVKKQAPAQKLVLTTTVTDTGVEMIDGDRARVLVFADQSNTATAASAASSASATSAGTTYAAAMFAVDVVRQDGTWKIATIDTFG
jgi:Mce-associated membrane protein